MKNNKLVILVLIGVLVFSTLALAEITSEAVSLPDKMPNIITQTEQKDKAAIVYIQSIVSGTVVYPSFIMVQGAGTPGGTGTIVGTWQSATETITFTADGKFMSTTAQYGSYSGTYAIQGNTIIVNYDQTGGSAQFTFAISGNTLQLSHPNIGTVYYTRVGAAAQTGTTDIVANAENIQLTRDTSPTATIESEQLSAEFSGTGFVVSPDGYIITNAHVVLADEDAKSVLFNTLVRNLEAGLYAEFSKFYQISEEDREKVVQILLNKLLNYFVEHGSIQNAAKDFYALSGVASSEEDFKTKRWPAVVKKQGTVIETVGGESTWGRDVAIIKVERSNLPTVTLGDSDKVQTGEPVFVIGYPGGASGIPGVVKFTAETAQEPSTSAGIISSRKKLLTGVEVLQTNAEINKGNSGGPVYNDKGEVIGIATFKAGGFGGSTMIENINYMMPISLAKEYMKELNINNEHSVLDTKYSEALNAFWERNCNKAITKMKEVLTLYPGHPYAQEYITECERAKMSGEVSKPINTGWIISIIVIVLVVGAFFFLKKKGYSISKPKK